MVDTTARYDQAGARAERARRAENRQERSLDPQRYPTLAEFAKPMDAPVRTIVGREKERDQILASLCRPELSNVLLLAPPGSGKALADDTLVAVDDTRGYVPISELVFGDRVFGGDGASTEVIGVFPQGVKDAWQVSTGYGEPVVCNDEHIWTVRDNRTGATVTRTLGELMGIGLSLYDGSPRFAVPAAAGIKRGVKRSVRMTLTTAMRADSKVSEDVLGANTRLRETVLERIVDRYSIVPYDREHVLVRTGSPEQAVRLMRLLSSCGRAARVCDTEPTAVCWRFSTPEFYPITVEKLDEPVSMTCIKVAALDGLFQAGRGHVVTHNTALTQSVMLADPEREYIEVDPAKLVTGLNNPNEMGARLKALFDEAEAHAAAENRELVLFIDEFHQIVQLSEAAVEALKPVLADSGARGLRFIGATTFDEYNTYVKKNAPLDERLQRISLTPTDDEGTVRILRGMVQRYGVDAQFPDDNLLTQIVEITNRYQPASVQPRKSIRQLDAMIGKYRYTGELMDMSMLVDIVAQSSGVNLAFNVDGTSIKKKLDSRVYSQDMATTVVNRRLQLCVADLHDHTRPMASFLFAGPTGVGKLSTDSTPVPVFAENGSVFWKNHGDLQMGDQVFDRTGAPTEVLGVFPQGQKDIYRVTLTDGRSLDVGAEHLWGVYTAKMRKNKHAGKDVAMKVMSTKDIMDSGVVTVYDGGTRRHLKYFVPANGAVQWPEADLQLDPYALGALIGNGCLTLSQLTLSSDDAYTVYRVADTLGATPRPKRDSLKYVDYSWVFPTGRTAKNGGSALLQTKDVLSDAENLVGCYSKDRRIPKKYMSASIGQRWELVRGLFDTDGTIESSTGRFNVSYSTFSKGLAEDVRELLFSLGVSNSVNVWTRERDGRTMVEYDVHVKVGNEVKAQFFALPRKKEIAEAAVVQTADRKRVKKFDMIGISDIEKLPEQESATCIYVDNPEHLYQAGRGFVVTHNTELTKQLANLMFGDDRNRLIRFDMSEFADDNSLAVFRQEITRAVGNQGHAVILLDEIEKASRWILRLLLQVLDDGRMSDENGRQVNFLNSYVVMTTNAGSGVYNNIAQYASSDTGDGSNLDEYLTLIETAIKNQDFPPELLGRIDEIVPFQPLSRETQRKVIRNKLKELRDNVMLKHNVQLSINDKVLQYLADDLVTTAAEAGGARGATRTMQKEIATAIATFINENPERKKLMVYMKGDLRSDNKDMRKTRAVPAVAVVE